MNSELLREGLNQIKKQYGVATLHEERKTIALFADFVPDGCIERNALKHTYESGAMRILLSATEGSSNSDYAVLQAVDVLKSKALMDQRIAEILVKELCLVVGIANSDNLPQETHCEGNASDFSMGMNFNSFKAERGDRLVCHLNSTYAVTQTGHVFCAGVADYEKKIYSIWNDVGSISKYGTIAVKTDGTVLYNDSYKSGLETKKFKSQLSKWRDVVKVCSSIGSGYVVGLKKDGTLMGGGYFVKNEKRSRSFHQFLACDNVIDIVNYDISFAALKQNGTVVCYDFNREYSDASNNWEKIKKIELTLPAIVGLNNKGEVLVQDFKIPNWEGIVDFYCNRFCSNYVSILGLRSDGKVLSCGVITDSNSFLKEFYGVDNWKNVVAIAGGKDHVVGLKKDGTVVACGKNDYGQCLVDSWRDIIQIACGENHTVGLRKDGSVVACGNNKYGQCNVEKWNLFN